MPWPEKCRGVGEQAGCATSWLHPCHECQQDFVVGTSGLTERESTGVAWCGQVLVGLESSKYPFCTPPANAHAGHHSLSLSGHEMEKKSAAPKSLSLRWQVGTGMWQISCTYWGVHCLENRRLQNWFCIASMIRPPLTKLGCHEMTWRFKDVKIFCDVWCHMLSSSDDFPDALTPPTREANCQDSRLMRGQGFSPKNKILPKVALASCGSSVNKCDAKKNYSMMVPP